MPAINLLSSTNRFTNRTNVLGGPKKSGLAPTTNMRPCFTKLPGYGVAEIAANNEYEELNIKQCGFNKSLNDSLSCLVQIGFPRQTRAERIIALLSSKVDPAPAI
jgi:hypothetical protein